MRFTNSDETFCAKVQNTIKMVCKTLDNLEMN